MQRVCDSAAYPSNLTKKTKRYNLILYSSKKEPLKEVVSLTGSDSVTKFIGLFYRVIFKLPILTSRKMPKYALLVRAL